MSDMDIVTLSEDEEQKGIGTTTTDVTKTKPIPHVAPRIDAEYYQAQVLDIGTINGSSSSSVAGDILKNKFVSQLFAFGDLECLLTTNFFDSLSALSRVVVVGTDAERNWYGGNHLVSTTATSRQQVIKGNQSSF
jgi:hypothetical protein